MDYRATQKQSEIIKLVLEAADAGESLHFADLKKRLSYSASQQSVQQSIRILVDHGMIEKKTDRDGRKMLLYPTLLAYHYHRATPLEA